MHSPNTSALNTTFEIETLNQTYDSRSRSFQRTTKHDKISSCEDLTNLDKQFVNLKGTIKSIETKYNKDGKKVRIIKIKRNKRKDEENPKKLI